MSRAEAVRAELVSVGADEFCRRRLQARLPPARLVEAVARMELLDEDEHAYETRARRLKLDWTSRRLRVLELTAAGLTREQVARQINWSLGTVTDDLKVIHGLLHTRTPAHAVAVAYRTGILH